MALDPAIVFLDEPSAGLDPLTSRRLDDLLLELRASLGTTFVVVTHELASIFAIADDSVFLDPATRGITARGDPKRARARGGRPDRPGVPHPRRGGPLSRRASPRLIGAFVLGALLLLVAGAVALGSRSLWGKGDRFVIYFDEPIKGLAIGAPVTFRGVNVGRVVAISAYFRTDGTAIDVPVVVELRRDAVLLETGAQPTPEVMELLVAKGARARLQLESLVTARQYVGIDFFPNTEPRRVAGPVDLPQIPSVRSPIAGILASADDLALAAPDLVKEAGEVLRLLHGFLAGQPGADAAALLADTARLAHALGDPEGPLPRTLATLPDLTAKLAGAAANLDRLTGDLRAALDARNTQAAKLLGELGDATVAVRRLSEQAGQLVAENRANLKDFSDRGLPELAGLIEDATRTVNELDGTLKDLRQDPSRFLFGNQTPN